MHSVFRQERLMKLELLPESKIFDTSHHPYNSEHIVTRDNLSGDMADGEIQEHAILGQAPGGWLDSN